MEREETAADLGDRDSGREWESEYTPCLINAKGYSLLLEQMRIRV